MAYAATHLEASASPSSTPMMGTTSRTCHGLRQVPSQTGTNRVAAMIRKPVTYTSFMAMRELANSIPSASASAAANRPTERRRNSSRARRYRKAAVAAPMSTPGRR